MTADDKLTLYADGVEMGYTDYWPTTVSSSIPDSTKILAVKGRNAVSLVEFELTPTKL